MMNIIVLSVAGMIIELRKAGRSTIIRIALKFEEQFSLDASYCSRPKRFSQHLVYNFWVFVGGFDVIGFYVVFAVVFDFDFPVGL